MIRKINNDPITSATRQVRPRVLGVVFGGYLSAQAVFRLDPEYSGPAIRPACSFLLYFFALESISLKTFICSIIATTLSAGSVRASSKIQSW